MSTKESVRNTQPFIPSERAAIGVPFTQPHPWNGLPD
jgi:hypothetical protein